MNMKKCLFIVFISACVIGSIISSSKAEDCVYRWSEWHFCGDSEPQDRCPTGYRKVREIDTHYRLVDIIREQKRHLHLCCPQKSGLIQVGKVSMNNAKTFVIVSADNSGLIDFGIPVKIRTASDDIYLGIEGNRFRFIKELSKSNAPKFMIENLEPNEVSFPEDGRQIRLSSWVDPETSQEPPLYLQVVDDTIRATNDLQLATRIALVSFIGSKRLEFEKQVTIRTASLNRYFSIISSP